MIYGLAVAAVAGQPSGALTPPPPHPPVSFSNERTPLAAYVAAASCARALSASFYPLPPPSILTLDYLQSYTKYIQYTLILDILHK